MKVMQPTDPTAGFTSSLAEVCTFPGCPQAGTAVPGVMTATNHLEIISAANNSQAFPTPVAQGAKSWTPVLPAHTPHLPVPRRDPGAFLHLQPYSSRRDIPAFNPAEPPPVSGPSSAALCRESSFGTGPQLYHRTGCPSWLSVTQPSDLLSLPLTQISFDISLQDVSLPCRSHPWSLW